MAADRFQFQRACVDRALDGADFGNNNDSDLLVLNVGANDDNGDLKSIDPVRVINTDLFAHDQVLDRPNVADVLFDAARDRWPYNDQAAVLVVLGDILEHLKPDEIRACLTEARRVSRKLCITVPEDHRQEVNDERADTYPRGAVHRTVVHEQLLRRLLRDTGWRVVAWDFVLYDDGTFWDSSTPPGVPGRPTRGHFVECE